MSFEEFKEQFTNDVKETLEERGVDVTVAVNTVNKLNDSYEAMTVTPEGSNVGVNVNIDRFYDAVQDGADYDEVVYNAVRTVEKGIAQRPEVDVSALTDYEQMKDKLAMEVVSTDSNAELLSRVPHKEIEDMSIVYRFVLESNEDGRASILVTDQLLESMGVSPEQLHADALRTAPELKPVVIKGMSEVMAEMMGMSAEDLAMMGMPTDPADEQMYVATVPDKIHYWMMTLMMSSRL